MELHAQAKVVVLPYFSEFYRLGCSGRLQDALASGAYPFVPESTSIYSWLKAQDGFVPFGYDSNFAPLEISNSVKGFLK